jgi:hypothetical protein
MTSIAIGTSGATNRQHGRILDGWRTGVRRLSAGRRTAFHFRVSRRADGEPDQEGLGSLSVSRQLDAELVSDIAQRVSWPALRPVAPRQHGHAPEQHTLGRAAPREERRRNASNASADDHDSGSPFPFGGPGWTVGDELGDPRRPGRLVHIRHATPPDEEPSTPSDSTTFPQAATDLPGRPEIFGPLVLCNGFEL